jgi:hypothetical protein
MFSAILVEKGVEPPRNHKVKLDKVRTLCPNIFDERVERHEHGGVSYSGAVQWDSIENYYREWLQSRYETFDLTPGEARGRVAESLQAQNFVITHLADQDGTDAYELAKVISKSAYGYHYSQTTEAISMAHDHLFSEAEHLGEMMGSRLGTKMASATNFSDFDFIAGDTITREIIEEDEQIAAHAAKVYMGFVRLAEEIREKRLFKIMDGEDAPTKEQMNLAPNFMFSMKAKYHGQSVEEISQGLADTMARALGNLPIFSEEDD